MHAKHPANVEDSGVRYVHENRARPVFDGKRTVLHMDALGAERADTLFT